MRLQTTATGLVLIAGMAGVIAQAGFPANTYVYQSKVQDELATHVLVGTIRAFHRLKSEPTTRPEIEPHTLNLYVAELKVLKVEKGQGLQPGDIAYVRFHSVRTLQEVEQPFPVWGCEQFDQRVTPGLGHDARVYAKLNDDYQYVADYPESFFRGSKKRLDPTDPGVTQFVRERPMLLFIPIAGLGLLFSFLIGRRAGRGDANRPLGSNGLENRCHDSLPSIQSRSALDPG